MRSALLIIYSLITMPIATMLGSWGFFFNTLLKWYVDKISLFVFEITDIFNG